MTALIVVVDIIGAAGMLALALFIPLGPHRGGNAGGAKSAPTCGGDAHASAGRPNIESRP